MNLSFENKVALVTGAASGMGLATAKAFAEAGAAVMLADFKEEAVKAEAQKLVAAGHKAIAMRCDVSDDAQVAAMVDRTVAEFGRLDAAFNNASIMARIAPTADSTREDWDTQIARDVVSGDEQAYAEIAKHVPIGRAGRPEEIASAVLWLCSPGASYVVGHALTVDGGMTVV